MDILNGKLLFFTVVITFYYLKVKLTSFFNIVT